VALQSPQHFSAPIVSNSVNTSGDLKILDGIQSTGRKLRSRSCIIDGEAVACGGDGIASFDRIRYRHNDDGVFLYARDE
jgi:hypothetical protein